jgi:hypothetical protein
MPKSLPADTDAAILRFRQIAAAAAEHALLANGPVSPDAALLDLCADALHRLSSAQKLREAIGRPPWNTLLGERDLEMVARRKEWSDRSGSTKACPKKLCRFCPPLES